MEGSTKAAFVTAAGAVLAAAITAGVWKSCAVSDKSNTATALPRVVVHVAASDPQDLANDLRRRLVTAGYSSSIEKVNRRDAPSRIQIRYFRRADEPAAYTLKDLMKAWGIEAEAARIRGYEGSATLDQLEVWLPPRVTR